MLEEMHDPVLSQPICQVGSEPPLLSSEKFFVHGHFCYLYNVAQYCQCHIGAEAAHCSRRKTYLGCMCSKLFNAKKQTFGKNRAAE